MDTDRVLIIRKSCLTGKVVWIGRYKNKHSASQGYYNARKAEMERERNKEAVREQRRQNILGLLDDCLAHIPITEALTPKQVEAAKALRNLGKEEVVTDHEFYNHVVEEKRLREADNKIRAEMRARGEKY